MSSNESNTHIVTISATYYNRRFEKSLSLETLHAKNRWFHHCVGRCAALLEINVVHIHINSGHKNLLIMVS